VLLLGTVVLGLYLLPWGFAREVSAQEAQTRVDIVRTAESWLGRKESDGTHMDIVDLYNSHTPLARGYEVTYEDEWCATFVSAVSIGCNMTDIIPTECGCEPQIELFQEMDCWEENDDYIPLPGDVIFYHWNCLELGDCDGWSDHVGLVVGTLGPFIKVIEGNKDDAVGYRYIIRWDPRIRGYGLPEY
jgi:hypothetical protein